MKKLVIFSLIAVMAAGAAFAQVADGISVGAWGRGAFAPLIIETKEKDGAEEDGLGIDGVTKIDNTGGVFAGTGSTWNDNTVDYEVDIKGDLDYVGFALGLTAQGGFGGNATGANVWVKPFASDLLKVSVGKMVDDTLRGKVGSLDDGFENFVLNGSPEADGIFTRFSTNIGFMLTSAPIEGLFIGVGVGTGSRTDGNLWNIEKTFTDPADPRQYAAQLYRNIQAGLGYEIAGIGHFRAQWVGGFFGTYNEDKADTTHDSYDPAYQGYIDTTKVANFGPDSTPFTDDDTGTFTNGDLARIEAAFALTAVENLTLDLGFKFWLPYTYDIEGSFYGKHNKGIEVGLGAIYAADALNIAARIDADFGSYIRMDKDNDDSANGLGLEIEVVPSYDIGLCVLGLDLGFNVKGSGKDINGDAVEKGEGAGSMQFGVGGWAKKAFGNGYIKAGLTFTTAPIPSDKDIKARDSSEFKIPVILQYSF